MSVRDRLGLASYVGCAGSLEEFLELAGELGVGFVELLCERPLALPADLPSDRRREIRELLVSLSVRPLVHASFYDVNLASLNPRMGEAALEQTKDCLALAADLDAPLLDLHPGNLPGDYPSSFLDRSRKLLLERLERLVEEAEEVGVVVALENKQRGRNLPLIATEQDHLDLVRHLDSPFCRATFDAGHANTYHLDLTSYVLTLAPYLANVHLHDNRGDADEHLPLGSGTIIFPQLLEALNEAGYKGPIILEVKSWPGLQISLRTLTSMLSE